MTTAYNMVNTVIRPRKRPQNSSTNAAIVQQEFGHHPVKNLPIPIDINAYNHHMGGVDIANQLRASYTTLQERNKRYWKPLFHWLLDIAITNAYLLYRASYSSLEPEDGHERRHFQEQLVASLTSFNYTDAREHTRVVRPTRAYCIYCRNNWTRWTPKHAQPRGPRAFGTDLTNLGPPRRARRVFRGSKTQYGCLECGVVLCKKGDCWQRWHETSGGS